MRIIEIPSLRIFNETFESIVLDLNTCFHIENFKSGITDDKNKKQALG